MPNVTLPRLLGVGFLCSSLLSLHLLFSGHTEPQPTPPPTPPPKLEPDVLQFPYADLQNKDNNHLEHMVLPPDTKNTVGRWLRMWQPDIQLEFQQLVDEKVEQDDPRLINLIRKIIMPPSPHRKLKISRKAVKTPQAAAALQLLNNKRNGFFIECGALDGERSSNTFFLEKEMGWTGLLIEMDPYFFLQILGRNRKSWSINACLSPSQHPNRVSFIESDGGLGKLSDKGGIPMPCFPMYSLLLAINQTQVDFFSLDVEGFELPIMQGFPWNKIDVSVLTVEYAHGESKELYKKHMISQGYTVYKDIHHHDFSQLLFVDDLVFVKNGLRV